MVSQSPDQNGNRTREKVNYFKLFYILWSFVVFFDLLWSFTIFRIPFCHLSQSIIVSKNSEMYFQRKKIIFNLSSFLMAEKMQLAFVIVKLYILKQSGLRLPNRSRLYIAAGGPTRLLTRYRPSVVPADITHA